MAPDSWYNVSIESQGQGCNCEFFTLAALDRRPLGTTRYLSCLAHSYDTKTTAIVLPTGWWSLTRGTMYNVPIEVHGQGCNCEFFGSDGRPASWGKPDDWAFYLFDTIPGQLLCSNPWVILSHTACCKVLSSHTVCDNVLLSHTKCDNVLSSHTVYDRLHYHIQYMNVT